MPELPDVEVYRKEADKARDVVIKDVDINDNHFIDVSKNKLSDKIVGKRIKENIRRGKYLFITTENHENIILHFGMTGSLKYLPESEDEPKFTKCAFMLGNDHILYYLSKRKLGTIDITRDLDAFIKEKELGPDIMKISTKDFIKGMKEKSSMIKTALTDQSLFSGIGNVYADEVLYQSRLHPKTKTGKLSEDELKKIFVVTKEVIRTAIEKDADVSKFPDDYLLPHRDKGEDCPGCSGKIEKIRISGRTGYYCPSCQKKQ